MTWARSIFNRLGITLLLLSPNLAAANPVSFKDGWGIMPATGKDWTDLTVNYSLTNRYAIGLSEYFRRGSSSTATFDIGQFNYLVKRWNEMDSQANIYASAGLGARRASTGDECFAAYTAIEANYETRRVYTLLSGESLWSTEENAFNRLRYRAGVAPYEAPFDELQTWLFVQVDYMPEFEETAEVTPLVRFFYNNYALEIGASLDGAPFFSAMAHF